MISEKFEKATSINRILLAPAKQWEIIHFDKYALNENVEFAG